MMVTQVCLDAVMAYCRLSRTWWRSNSCMHCKSHCDSLRIRLDVVIKPWHNRRNVGKWTLCKCVVGSIYGRSFWPMCATVLSPRPSWNFSPGFLGCGALLVNTSFDSLQQWMMRTCNVLSPPLKPLSKLLGMEFHDDYELFNSFSCSVQGHSERTTTAK